MTSMEQIKDFIKQRTEAIGGTAAEWLYSCYESKATNQNETIRNSFLTIEEQTDGLPFERSNQICSAAIAACAECEKLAFLDGVTFGAGLIIELYNEKQDEPVDGAVLSSIPQNRRS